MCQKSGQEIPPLNFVVNEREEFLNIFNYKNVKCFKSCNYIYIGQYKKEEPHGSKENDCDLVCKKGEDIKKIETKEFTSSREKSDKKKKKKCSKCIKDGYGILITLRRNTFGEEVIVNKFIGNWKNNKKSGLGFNLYLNGNVYYGYYENNARNGWGHFEWRDSQSSYEGNWVNNHMNGKGTYKSKTFSFDGHFYNNKFLNSSGEWIDVVPMEKEKKKNVSLLKRDVITGDEMINLVCLPFDFLKSHLKKIADMIKYKYNKVPFFMCSKGFIEKHRDFNLSKFIFLSYYFGPDEPFCEEGNYQLLFDGVQNEGGNSKVGWDDPNLKPFRSGTPSDTGEEAEGDSSSRESSCSSGSERSDGSPSSRATSSSGLSSGENEGSERGGKDGKPPSNSSNWSNGRAHSNLSKASAASHSSHLSSLSAISNSWYGSKGTAPPHDDLDHSKRSALNSADLTRNESKGSSESDLKEYIKNANISNASKEESLAAAPSNVSEICQNGMNSTSGICNEDTSYEMEERKKNEMYQLVKKYVHIYANLEGTSSEYSIKPSETESSDEGGDLLKVESKEHVDPAKRGGNEQSGGTKETDGKETVGENANPKANNASSEEANTSRANPSESTHHLKMRKKKIEKELSKIKIDTHFLEKLKNCNLTCTHKIKQKMETSMMLKYPFIFSLSVSEDPNKYETITREFLLESCKIPTLWLLKNYFGATENKLPEEIFSPPFFDFYNSNMNMPMHPHFQTPQNEDDEENFNAGEISPLNFFLITDLLVGDTKDAKHLKCLVRDKFMNFSFLSNLFFLIIE
ncbi:hypothetical protein PVMG_02906 [Plasmodium vivax Mauritania I]|uniref:MORN repeat protein n=1 Tax=Plasmodium vivax Mauritania I TaxID=1035515 RepID=A0A0J9T7U8_PLAVI|nr:hypothetical protein PVMG_02906 [Plasmodium vivax Mauritania I]